MTGINSWITSDRNCQTSIINSPFFRLLQHQDIWLTPYDLMYLYVAFPLCPTHSRCPCLYFSHHAYLLLTLLNLSFSPSLYLSLSSPFTLSVSLSLSAPRGFSGYRLASLAPFRKLLSSPFGFWLILAALTLSSVERLPPTADMTPPCPSGLSAELFPQLSSFILTSQ